MAGRPSGELIIAGGLVLLFLAAGCQGHERRSEIVKSGELVKDGLKFSPAKSQWPVNRRSLFDPLRDYTIPPPEQLPRSAPENSRPLNVYGVEVYPKGTFPSTAYRITGFYDGVLEFSNPEPLSDSAEYSARQPMLSTARRLISEEARRRNTKLVILDIEEFEKGVPRTRLSIGSQFVSPVSAAPR
jgi:hypothetical protein